MDPRYLGFVEKVDWLIQQNKIMQGRIGSLLSNANDLLIQNVPLYANDAAAKAAGLITGNLYKTTTTGITALNIVP